MNNQTQFSTIQSDVIFNYIGNARDCREEEQAIELLSLLFSVDESDIKSEYERRL